jgi:hypothetical protein
MKRKHIGSRFEDLLAEDGNLESCRTEAMKFKAALKPEKVSRPGANVAMSRRSGEAGVSTNKNG